jgi:hypothetical protein
MAYLMVIVQPLPLSALFPSALRLLLGFGFRFTNDFSHDWHCAFVQWVGVDAIADTPRLPQETAVAVNMAAIRLVRVI